MSRSANFVVPFALALLFLFLYGCAVSGGQQEAAAQPKAPGQQEAAAKPQAPAEKVPVQQAAKCGNGFLEAGEQCEGGVGCADNTVCNDATCKCEPKPAPIAQPVCGNGVKETGEACETGSDCASGSTCTACACVPKPAPVQQEAFCGNGNLETGEECDVGTATKPAGNKCPSGEYCSACKCYTAAEPVSCLSNHKYWKATGVNQFIWTTLPACGDDCDAYGVDFKCDLTTCTCVVKSVTSHTCGNNVKESVEECDGTDNSWCRSDQACGPECTCISAGGT